VGVDVCVCVCVCACVCVLRRESACMPMVISACVIKAGPLDMCARMCVCICLHVPLPHISVRDYIYACMHPA
jgi:hypothetical protein